MQKQATKARAKKATKAPSSGIDTTLAPLDSSVAPAIVAAQADPVSAKLVSKTRQAHEIAEKHAFGLAYRYLMRNESRSRLPIKAGSFTGFGTLRGSKPSMRSASVIIALCCVHRLPLRAGTVLPLQFNGFHVETGVSSDTVLRYDTIPGNATLTLTDTSVATLREFIGDFEIKAVTVTL